MIYLKCTISYNCLFLFLTSLPDMFMHNNHGMQIVCNLFNYAHVVITMLFLIAATELNVSNEGLAKIWSHHHHHIRFWYLRCCGCPGLRGRQHLATPHTRSP